MGRDSERISNLDALHRIHRLRARVGEEESVNALSSRAAAALEVQAGPSSPRNTSKVTYALTLTAPSLARSFWHSMRVPPLCTRSSTTTTCRPAGSPSFNFTCRLDPSRTLSRTTGSSDCA